MAASLELNAQFWDTLHGVSPTLVVSLASCPEPNQISIVETNDTQTCESLQSQKRRFDPCQIVEVDASEKSAEHHKSGLWNSIFQPQTSNSQPILPSQFVDVPQNSQILTVCDHDFHRHDCPDIVDTIKQWNLIHEPQSDKRLLQEFLRGKWHRLSDLEVEIPAFVLQQADSEAHATAHSVWEQVWHDRHKDIPDISLTGEEFQETVESQASMFQNPSPLVEETANLKDKSAKTHAETSRLTTRSSKDILYSVDSQQTSSEIANESDRYNQSRDRNSKSTSWAMRIWWSFCRRIELPVIDPRISFRKAITLSNLEWRILPSQYPHQLAQFKKWVQKYRNQNPPPVNMNDWPAYRKELMYSLRTPLQYVLTDPIIEIRQEFGDSLKEASKPPSIGSATSIKDMDENTKPPSFQKNQFSQTGVGHDKASIKCKYVDKMDYSETARKDLFISKNFKKDAASFCQINSDSENTSVDASASRLPLRRGRPPLGASAQDSRKEKRIRLALTSSENEAFKSIEQKESFAHIGEEVEFPKFVCGFIDRTTKIHRRIYSVAMELPNSSAHAPNRSTTNSRHASRSAAMTGNESRYVEVEEMPNPVSLNSINLPLKFVKGMKIQISWRFRSSNHASWWNGIIEEAVDNSIVIQFAYRKGHSKTVTTRIEKFIPPRIPKIDPESGSWRLLPEAINSSQIWPGMVVCCEYRRDSMRLQDAVVQEVWINDTQNQDAYSDSSDMDSFFISSKQNNRKPTKPFEGHAPHSGHHVTLARLKFLGANLGTKYVKVNRIIYGLPYDLHPQDSTVQDITKFWIWAIPRQLLNQFENEKEWEDKLKEAYSTSPHDSPPLSPNTSSDNEKLASNSSSSNSKSYLLNSAPYTVWYIPFDFQILHPNPRSNDPSFPAVRRLLHPEIDWKSYSSGCWNLINANQSLNNRNTTICDDKKQKDVSNISEINALTRMHPRDRACRRSTRSTSADAYTHSQLLQTTETEETQPIESDIMESENEKEIVKLSMAGVSNESSSIAPVVTKNASSKTRIVTRKISLKGSNYLMASKRNLYDTNGESWPFSFHYSSEPTQPTLFQVNSKTIKENCDTGVSHNIGFPPVSARLHVQPESPELKPSKEESQADKGRKNKKEITLFKGKQKKNCQTSIQTKLDLSHSVYSQIQQSHNVQNNTKQEKELATFSRRPSNIPSSFSKAGFPPVRVIHEQLSNDAQETENE